MAALVEEIEDLYRRRFGEFVNGIAPLSGSHEQARDAVQEAFIRALRKRRTFRGDGTLEAWVWRIATRVALDARRHKAAVEWDDLMSTIALPEPERDPLLAEAISELPPRRRLMVFLRYFADLSYAQIADVCEVDPGTVAASLAQARDKLAAKLDREEVAG